MNLHFISSSFLFGLFACAIPIIIHLIFKRRYKRIEWGAMKFLLAAYKKTKTSLLLENLLLLILRICIIILLVFIFARPIARMSPMFSDSRASESFLIVIDNSYSMGVRNANVSPFEKAKKQAQTIMEKVKKNDKLSLVAMNEVPEQIFSFVPVRSSKKRDEILQKIDNLALTELGTDLLSTINLVKQIVYQKEYTNKHVFIITDFQKNIWQKACQTASFLELIHDIRKHCISFTLLDVGVPDAQNVGITNLKSDGVVTTSGHSHFKATICNYGLKNYIDLALTLYVDGRKQKTRYVSLGANQQTDVSFYPSFITKGNHYIAVELAPDNLLADNKRYCSFEVIDHIKVLCIDGDPQEKAFESETSYFIAAIGTTPDELIQVAKVNIGDLTPEIHFQNYDVVLLANVQTFANQQRFSRLENFVERGGGLFIWLGSNVLYEYYNQEMYRPGRELLPAEIKGSAMGTVAGKDDSTPFSLAGIEQHQIWRYFYENRRLMEDLRKCFIFKFFPVVVDPQDENVSILARYDTPRHHPAFLERRFGRGKVILSTTTLDCAWNNFHTDQHGHIFVILIHEFIQYLVMSPMEENNIYVKMPIMKKFDFFIQGARIAPPNRETKAPDRLETLEKGAAYRIIFRDTNQSGIYQIELAIPSQIKAEHTALYTKHFVAVNVRPEEGNIRYMARTELLNYFKNFKIKYEKDLKSNKLKKQTTKKDEEYWHQLLIMLLCFTLAETFLAMWFGRYN